MKTKICTSQFSSVIRDKSVKIRFLLMNCHRIGTRESEPRSHSYVMKGHAVRGPGF